MVPQRQTVNAKRNSTLPLQSDLTLRKGAYLKFISRAYFNLHTKLERNEKKYCLKDHLNDLHNVSKTASKPHSISDREEYLPKLFLQCLANLQLL